jgi:sugar/nucleoside kinase (ribokinase family)
MKHFDIALFGPVFVDHVLTGLTRLPGPGEEVFATGYRREAGGGCFNTACGMARLGALTTCFAMAGREDSHWLLERVRGFGVVTDNVRFTDMPTGMTVAASLPADRAFFTYDGANHDLLNWLESPELPEQLAVSRHVHFACPLPPGIGLSLVRKLHALGSTVSLDVGWQETWLRDPEVWPLLAELDWFLPNEMEARLMTGQSGVADMLREFSAHGAHRVAVKLGAHGAALWNGVDILCQPAITVTAVDTTGAGDAFNAGFLHAFLAELPENICLNRGTICGSLSTRQAGSLAALPDLNEVLEHYENDTER